jgi:hypothetical protein
MTCKRRYLDCEGCGGVDTAALTALAEYCGDVLETLDCDNCGDSVNDTGLCAIVGSCPRLCYLNASGCDVTDVVLMHLGRAECGRRLTELHLHGTEIGERGLSALAAVADALQWLGVSNCEGVTDTSVLELHRSCSRLRMMQVGGCPRLTAATKIDKEFCVAATAHGRWPYRPGPGIG